MARCTEASPGSTPTFWPSWGLGGAPGVPDSGPLAATGLMGTSTVEQLLENVCLLLASRTRDVVKSALGFIKVAVVVMDVAHMAKHVQLVVSVPFPRPVATRPENCRQRPSGALRSGGFQHFLSHVLSSAAGGRAGALEGPVVEVRGTAPGPPLVIPHALP